MKENSSTKASLALIESLNRNTARNSQKYKSNTSPSPAYQPIPNILADNSEMTNNTDDNGEVIIDRTGAGALPTTYSSQQLMQSSDSESVGNGGDGGRAAGGADNNENRNHGTPLRLSHVSRSQWLTVTVLCFVNLINYMDRFTIAGVLEDIQRDFQIDNSYGGLLQTVFIISYMLCAPIFGYLGDRYSRRWIMAVGVVLWSATTLLGSFMKEFGWFITFRALVGIGEASYSTIAPTIISDLFVRGMRSKMLAIFYFAIPVGSGFGSTDFADELQVDKSSLLMPGRKAGDWRFALRVTPALGVIAAILILITKDPERGESEGGHDLRATAYKEDLKYLMKNRSFVFSTIAFTCVAFVTGALAWWSPTFIYQGLKLQPHNEDIGLNDVSYKFGIIAMIAGLIGVPMGTWFSERFRPAMENCDPYICAVALLISSPLIYCALVLPVTSTTLCFLFVFAAQLSLNLCWPIVADMLLVRIKKKIKPNACQIAVLPPTVATQTLVRTVSFQFGAITMASGILGVTVGSLLSQKLVEKHAFADPFICGIGLLYVVVPTRRSTAEAFQILISHTFGDAGSPYLIGLISEVIRRNLRSSSPNIANLVHSSNLNSLSLTLNETIHSTLTSEPIIPLALTDVPQDSTSFYSLQYALFMVCFVEVLGGIFFLITAVFITEDKHEASQAAQGCNIGKNIETTECDISPSAYYKIELCDIHELRPSAIKHRFRLPELH
uniref:Major facilitator superfamily (MFS) profile domain-containing protein n=1 Tax=Glossina morsitans morsitans TaxID=37546 RepID=A0A1B0FH04_GLOMM